MIKGSQDLAKALWLVSAGAVVVAAFSLSECPREGWAQGAADTEPAAAAGSPSGTTNSAEPAAPLAGGVSRATLKAAAGLKAIGEASHRIKRAAGELIIECQREDLVVVAEPDVIGPMVIPAVPDPSGTASTGAYLPPRRKYVDLYVNQLTVLVPILQDELRQTALPPAKQSEVAGSWQAMQALAAALDDPVGKLVALAENKELDRLAIGQQALAVHDEIEKLEKLRKEVFHKIK